MSKKKDLLEDLLEEQLEEGDLLDEITAHQEHMERQRTLDDHDFEVDPSKVKWSDLRLTKGLMCPQCSVGISLGHKEDIKSGKKFMDCPSCHKNFPYQIKKDRGSIIIYYDHEIHDGA